MKLPFLKTMVGKAFIDTAKEMNVQVYVVGGYVRDQLLNRAIKKDIDLVVVGNGIEYATNVSKKFKRVNLSIYKNFGTAQLKFPNNLEIEIVGARKESYRADSRKPIVEDGTLTDDLARRDFTINALAYNLIDDGELVDKYKGLSDLDNKIIKTPLDPDVTFSDDPLRMLRAIRFACQLNFDIEPLTLQSIARNADRITILSKERITDELNKMILCTKPSIAFLLLDECGLLPYILPELLKLKGVTTIDNKAHKDNFYHTLQVLDNITQFDEDNLWLRWAAILHDIGKPATQRFDKEIGWTFHGHEVVGAKMTTHIFNSLKLPMNEKMKYVQKLVNLHLRPIALTHEVTDSAIRRLIVDCGYDLDDLLKLCKADVTSKNPMRKERYLKRFDQLAHKIAEVEERDAMRNWRPAISGDDIMNLLSIRPGVDVGLIKEEVSNAILNGDIPNEREPALKKMFDIAATKGYKPSKNI
ncbi:MAG: HD domain-containing protein [Bacteroidota bacterium]|nr:HD domain-containing protein [Bacteroidota bacterium]